MVTFFSHCRAFVDEFKELQETAILSWKTAVPGCQVVLIGSESGIGLATAKLSVGWCSVVGTNSQRTPLVSSIFEMGEIAADYDLVCEISSDIVLGGDFLPALEVISTIERPFVVGQRWDIDPGAPADTAVLHKPSAADYFIYRKNTLGEIPPFAVGRTAYDNWLIWAAIHKWGLITIDATESITAAHINHGHPEYGTKEKMIQSDERKENHRLSHETGCNRWYGTNDAPFVLRRGEVVERE